MRTYKIKFSVFDKKWENLATAFMKKRDCKFVIVYEDDDDFDELIQKLRKNQKWHDDAFELNERLRVDYPIIAENAYIEPSIISLFRENRLIVDGCDCDKKECDGTGFKFDKNRLIKKID